MIRTTPYLGRIIRNTRTGRCFSTTINCTLIPQGYSGRQTVGELIQTGRGLEAVSILEDLIKEDENNVALRIDKATALTALGSYEEAIKLFDESLQMFPDQYNKSQIYVNKGTSYHRLRQLNEAIDCFNKSIQLNPENPVLYDKRLMSYLALQSYDDALRNVDKAIEILPTAKRFTMKAIVLREAGRIDECLGSIEEALCIDENDVKALVEKAKTLCEIKNFKDALPITEKVINLVPEGEKPEILMFRGNLLGLLGHDEECVAALTQAAEMNPLLKNKVANLLMHLQNSKNKNDS
ncbi:TPR repeat-containing protein [Acrasis kona]|uniref:TPR repeat-containing protein n=1 Tax=Acrasis kona TaxID=1008807 RepID=A0AAW2ZQ39_9EUKA